MSNPVEPVPAQVCIEHDRQDGLFYLSIEVEGGESGLHIGLTRLAFEELLDASCIVFLDLHHHVHTQVPVHSSAARALNSHLN